MSPSRIMDADDPYRYIQVQCHVAEITKEGAKEHIDKLSMKYKGRPSTTARARCVIYKNVPDKLDLHGKVIHLISGGISNAKQVRT